MFLREIQKQHSDDRFAIAYSGIVCLVHKSRFHLLGRLSDRIHELHILSFAIGTDNYAHAIGELASALKPGRA